MHTLRTVSLLVVVVACVKATPCPGYTAKNVKKTASTLTADLTLAGEGCNIYGADIPELRLEVGYDDGMFPTFSQRDSIEQHQLIMIDYIILSRFSDPCQNFGPEEQTVRGS